MAKNLLHLKSILIGAICMAALGSEAMAQVALTTLDAPYTQNFDGMGATGTTFAPNWTAVKASGSSTSIQNGSTLTMSVTTGTANAGAIYNVGSSGSTDRAFGTLASGSITPRFGASFINNTGKTITSIDLKGVMEQWRTGSSTAVTEVILFEYSLDAENVMNGTWIAHPAMNLVEKLTTSTTAAALDGNNPDNQTAISGTITNINWPVGATLWIRWTDKDDAGSDGMYALDNFELTPRAVEDLVAPTVVSTSPATGNQAVDHETSFSITFSEIVDRGTGAITVKNVTDNLVQSVSLGEVVILNNVATFNALLLPGKQYEITVPAGAFTDLSENLFPGISSGSWTFTTAVPNPFAQNFNQCISNLPGGWTQYSAVGDETWACSTFGRTGNAVQVNGFNAGAKNNEDWLISPAFDLSEGFDYPVLSFWSRTRFAGASLKLMVSTNYSGSGDPAAATWKEINGSFATLDSDIWTLSKDINLEKFRTSSVYIAFVYTSSTSAASRWTIDDFSIDNSETRPVSPVYFISSAGPITNFDFGFVSAQGPTAAKSFTFYALDLVTDLTVSAPAGFELSKDNNSFSSTLTYSPEEANDLTTVFARFANNTTTPGAFAGAIRFTSEGFAAQRGYLTASTLSKNKTLDVVTWNIEWFGHASLGPSDEERQLANTKKLILDQDAEVYCVQEIANEDAFKSLVRQLPGYKGFLSPHMSSPANAGSQRVGFIYKTAAIDSVTARGMLINPANPSNFWASGRLPYLFVADANVEGVKKRIHFIAVHAKANENSSAADALNAYNRRLHDVKVLKDSLDLYYPEANIIMLGDFNDDVDFTVANVTTTESTYKSFVDDAANYKAVTKDLSDAGLRTYITFDKVIDHFVISNELYADYVSNSAKVIIPFDLIENYAGTTSDHMPVSARFTLTPNIAFAAAAASVSEAAGTYQVTLNLTRSSASAQHITVAALPGTGTTASDFTNLATSYTIVVPAGETSATLPLYIVDDNLVEFDETLTFNVTHATGGFGYATNATFDLTIIDNDKSAVSFTKSAASVSENAGAYKVTLTLDQAPLINQVLTINLANSFGASYGTSAGSYTTSPAAVNGKLTFQVPAGVKTASFIVEFYHNTKRESDKVIEFSVSGDALSSGLAKGNTATFTLTILDETSPEVKGIGSADGLEVAPNPSRGDVTLYFRDASASTSSDLTLTLWNAQGQHMLTISGNQEMLTNRLNEVLRTAAGGMYILKVQHGNTYYSTRLMRN